MFDSLLIRGMLILKAKTGFLFFIPLLFSLTFNCKTTLNYKEFNKDVLELVAEAAKLEKEGRIEEALLIAQIVKGYEPDNKVIQSILEKANTVDEPSIQANDWLGFNKSKRAKLKNVQVWERILWYIPDRIADFFDIFSVTITTGPHWGASVWVTRAGQVTAFGGGSVGLGYFQKRNIGVRAEAVGEIGVGPIVPTLIGGGRAGSNGLDFILTKDIFHKPSDDLYEHYRDYWGVGAKVGFAFIGLEIEIHPVEIYDLTTGLFLYDPANDDFATTRYLRINPKLEYKIRNFTSKQKDYDKDKYRNENYSKN